MAIKLVCMRLGISIGVAILIGLTTGQDGWGLGLYALIPILWGAARSKAESFCIMMVFYLTASRGVFGGAPVFFGDGHPFRGFALWVASAFMLSIPWAALWCRETSAANKFFRLCLVLLLIILPPIGLWGWCNPLLSAGYIFPHTRFWGLLYLYLIWVVVWIKDSQVIRLSVSVFLVVVSLLVQVSVTPDSPVEWDAICTSFGRLYSGSDDTLGVYERHQTLAFLLRQTNRKYIVMPETVAGWWGNNTEELWQDVTKIYFESGRTYFVGAEVAKPGSKKYFNAVQIRGANHNTIAQRIPVPISMYKPWRDDGAIADIFGLGISKVDDQRIGILICYEPFLFMPSLVTLLAAPDVLVVISNSWWAKDTNLPALSDQCAVGWALLFDVPLVISKNS